MDFRKLQNVSEKSEPLLYMQSATLRSICVSQSENHITIKVYGFLAGIACNPIHSTCFLPAKLSTIHPKFKTVSRLKNIKSIETFLKSDNPCYFRNNSEFLSFLYI